MRTLLNFCMAMLLILALVGVAYGDDGQMGTGNSMSTTTTTTTTTTATTTTAPTSSDAKDSKDASSTDPLLTTTLSVVQSIIALL